MCFLHYNTDKVCRYLQFKEIVGNRIFITWNTSYFNNERVLKNSAPKNLCRMVKNNIPTSQINGTPMLPLRKLHLTKLSFQAQKGNSCGMSLTNGALAKGLFVLH